MHRNRRSLLVLVVGMLLVLNLVLVPAVMGKPLLTHVTPTFVPGFPNCADVAPGTTEMSFTATDDGIFTDGTLIVSITNWASSSFDWSANIGVDAVIVYDGLAANVYVYDPEATSDTALMSPIHPGDYEPYYIEEILFCYDVEATGEGCTPGYWKQEQHLDSWVAAGYSPAQTLESVFDVPDSYGLDNYTLLEALSFGGGSGTTAAARILLRAGVAALLNSAHPDVDYPSTTAEVIADVNTALASGSRSTMLALATSLDADNNLGCTLN